MDETLRGKGPLTPREIQKAHDATQFVKAKSDLGMFQKTLENGGVVYLMNDNTFSFLDSEGNVCEGVLQKPNTIADAPWNSMSREQRRFERMKLFRDRELPRAWTRERRAKVMRDTYGPLPLGFEMW